MWILWLLYPFYCCWLYVGYEYNYNRFDVWLSSCFDLQMNVKGTYDLIDGNETIVIEQ